MSHLLDPAVERATRVFMAIMRREAQRRHPQRVENPVPTFDDLTSVDKTILMNAIGLSVDAAINHRREIDKQKLTSRDPLPTV